MIAARARPKPAARRRRRCGNSREHRQRGGSSRVRVAAPQARSLSPTPRATEPPIGAARGVAAERGGAAAREVGAAPTRRRRPGGGRSLVDRTMELPRYPAGPGDRARVPARGGEPGRGDAGWERRRRPCRADARQPTRGRRRPGTLGGHERGARDLEERRAPTRAEVGDGDEATANTARANGAFGQTSSTIGEYTDRDARLPKHGERGTRRPRLGVRRGRDGNLNLSGDERARSGVAGAEEPSRRPRARAPGGAAGGLVRSARTRERSSARDDRAPSRSEAERRGSRPARPVRPRHLRARRREDDGSLFRPPGVSERAERRVVAWPAAAREAERSLHSAGSCSAKTQIRRHAACMEETRDEHTTAATWHCWPRPSSRTRATP